MLFGTCDGYHLLIIILSIRLMWFWLFVLRTVGMLDCFLCFNTKVIDLALSVGSKFGNKFLHLKNICDALVVPFLKSVSNINIKVQIALEECFFLVWSGSSLIKNRRPSPKMKDAAQKWQMQPQKFNFYSMNMNDIMVS